jgi:two-component system chemotaxis family response regulator WspR
MAMGKSRKPGVATSPQSDEYAVMVRQRDDACRALRDSQQQLMETNLALQRVTNIDGLTGLSNRRYFDECLDAEWKRAIRSQRPLSVLMIDIDHLKQYNDTYGHPAGDAVLTSVADALRKACERSTDNAARFGGEEFVMILPETDLAGTRHLGEKLRRGVEDLRLPHSDSSVGGYVTVSIGGASMNPRRGESPLSLVDAAEKALYEAKTSGRNRMVAGERIVPSSSDPNK